MATTIPANPTPATVGTLLQKITDPDPDFRFMALNDLITVFSIAKPEFLAHDYSTAARTVDHVVRALDDTNGEVQNQAIKCLGPMVKKLPYVLYVPMMEKLSSMEMKNSVDNSIPAVAMRSMVEALPRPIPGVQLRKEESEALGSIKRVLIPRFLGRTNSHDRGLLDAEDLSSDYVDVLIETVRCFGPALTKETEALHYSVVRLLEQDKATSTVKKRAVVAISMLAHYLSDKLLEDFIKRAGDVLASTKVTGVTRRLYISVLGSMARSIPSRFGVHLARLAPAILQTLSEEDLQDHMEMVTEGGEAALEFNELREAAFVALEAFLSACPTQMRAFTDASIDAALRYLRFDPNYAVDEDDEMEEDDEEEEDGLDDDDFDNGGDFDDDDDASWKLRRCAAKTLFTIVSTRSSGDLLDSGVLYKRVAPALIKRFDEREENVRLEVMSSMSLLVRKTGEGVIPDYGLDASQSEYLNQLPQTRKRRRQSSGGGASSFSLPVTSADLSGTGLTSPTTEKVPAVGPRADLANLKPEIIKAILKLVKAERAKSLQTSSLSAKLASIQLLNDMVVVERGGLGSYLEQIMGLVIEAIKPTGASASSASLSTAGASASATVGTLRIAALRLTSDIAKHHSSAVLQPYLSRMVTAVVGVVHDRYYKLSSEAIQTSEEIIKAITPPRARFGAQKFKGELQKLYDVIADRTTAGDADAEVRQKAIHALGTLLARATTSEGTSLLAEDKKKAALGHLLERLKNETTKLAAVRAIDNIAALSGGAVQFDPAWFRQVIVELALQLRKSNRALRGASMMALKHLFVVAPTGYLDTQSIESVSASIVPVVALNDAQLLGPGLLVLARLVEENPEVVLTSQLTESICTLLLHSTVAGSVLDSLIILVTKIGHTKQGQGLMTSLLKDVGVSGDPSVVGKVIGTLLVASGSSAGVSLDLFVQEVQKNSGDQRRASLALTVIGEAGLLLGSKFPLPPSLFLDQFTSDFDKVSVSAAVALGRAGAGNVPVYLPVILQSMKERGGSQSQYLLLQTIKEVLQQAALLSADISRFSSAIWDQILAAAGAEDNKAVCAECVGRMVIIDPKTYMPKLESLLRDHRPAMRVIAVQALRYTLPDDNEAFDALLKDSLVVMLKLALEDQETEIRRHALSTLNSASHNKPELILGHLDKLFPYVMKETVIKKELIREVQMGPFKHIIDDGLEVRKAAYETLYALMETAFTRVSTIDLYDRIVAGLSDDNDIRALCNLMVTKLAFIDPNETTRRLDSIAEAFRKTLSHKLKETAVKQEIEKQDEAIRAALRVTLLLGDKLKSALNLTGAAGSGGTGGTNQTWTSYWEWVNKDFEVQLKKLREESRESDLAM